MVMSNPGGCNMFVHYRHDALYEFFSVLIYCSVIVLFKELVNEVLCLLLTYSQSASLKLYIAVDCSL